RTCRQKCSRLFDVWVRGQATGRSAPPASAIGARANPVDELGRRPSRSEGSLAHRHTSAGPTVTAGEWRPPARNVRKSCLAGLSGTGPRGSSGIPSPRSQAVLLLYGLDQEATLARSGCAPRVSHLSLACPLPILVSAISSIAAANSVVQYLIQEALGSLTAGAAEELGGRRVVDHPAGLHEHDPVGHAAGKCHLVRDNHARHAVTP